MQMTVLDDLASDLSNARLAAFVAALDECSPWQIAGFDQTARHAQREHHSRQTVRRKSWFQQKNDYFADADQALRLKSDASFLFSMSHHGYIRERAVKSLNLKSRSGKVLTVLRCNDWVGAVRNAALRRLRSDINRWTVEDLSELAFFLLSKRREWGRGGAATAMEIMSQHHWPAALRHALMTEMKGPLARELRELLISPAFDDHLFDLSTSARSFQIRLVATQTILDRKARWLVGREWKWQDKSLGKKRRVNVFEERAIKISEVALEQVLSRASRDKCAAIRKLAANYLIQNGPQSDDTIEIVLKTDKNAAIRARMNFFYRKWRGIGPTVEI